MAGHTLRNLKLGNNEYSFIVSSRSNRSGFVHECELIRNGRSLAETKAQYYNRTWECYYGESVMHSCVSMQKSDVKDEIKRKFLSDNGYGRLTAARKVELEKLYAESEELKELDLLNKEVSQGYHKYGWN